MSQDLRRRLFDELESIALIDPHTHINALQPAAVSLADILGYHYYTELAHSSGLARERIEEPGLSTKEKVARIVSSLAPLENTIQYSWFVELSQVLLGFKDDRLTPNNWEALFNAAHQQMAQPDWSAKVMKQSKLEAVILTNDFDDPLAGWDTQVFVPCLRTDDLVFHFAKSSVQERLQRASGIAVKNAATMRQAIGKLFQHFTSKNCKLCAISLPPDFSPTKVDPTSADHAVQAALEPGGSMNVAHRRDLSNFVFWTLTEFCAEFRLPFDLMIGVNKAVYPGGVYQGQDLFDSRTSLVQYLELLNAFPQVVFPISVLASVTNQELMTFAWIFPNVRTKGHWWYSNVPVYIEHDASARLEAVPWTKQIGYYSDMYKLEFALPKFRMYKRILAKILAERFVINRGWSEDRALTLGRDVLRNNVDRVFFGKTG
jgi:glucuronate isomerase